MLGATALGRRLAMMVTAARAIRTFRADRSLRLSPTRCGVRRLLAFDARRSLFEARLLLLLESRLRSLFEPRLCGPIEPRLLLLFEAGLLRGAWREGAAVAAHGIVLTQDVTRCEDAGVLAHGVVGTHDVTRCEGAVVLANARRRWVVANERRR